MGSHDHSRREGTPSHDHVLNVQYTSRGGTEMHLMPRGTLLIGCTGLALLGASALAREPTRRVSSREAATVYASDILERWKCFSNTSACAALETICTTDGQECIKCSAGQTPAKNCRHTGVVGDTCSDFPAQAVNC